MGENPASGKGKRVPCPVDPNHTVFEQQLTSHVKVRPCCFQVLTIYGIKGAVGPLCIVKRQGLYFRVMGKEVFLRKPACRTCQEKGLGRAYASNGEGQNV